MNACINKFKFLDVFSIESSYLLKSNFVLVKLQWPLSGVPQSLIMGPILFSLCMLPFDNLVSQSNSYPVSYFFSNHCYADDMKLEN